MTSRPDIFAAAETPLLAGRDVSFSDTTKTPAVAVVNREFARRLFHSEDAVGRYFKNSSGQPIQIVGMVGDGKYFSLTEDPEPVAFFPISQEADCSHIVHCPAAARRLRHDDERNGSHHSQSDPRS